MLLISLLIKVQNHANTNMLSMHMHTQDVHTHMYVCIEFVYYR